MRHLFAPLCRRLILALTCIVLGAAGAHAQQQPVRFTSARLTVGEAITQIRTQTGYEFAYNPAKLDVTKVVTFRSGDTTLDKAMEQLAAGAGHSYSIVGKHILLIHTEETPQQKPQAEQKAEKVYDLEGQVSNYTRENLADANAGTNEPKLVYDTLVRVIPHDGAFRYPDVTRSIKLSALDAGAGQPFLMNTPPFIAVKVNLLYGATLTPNLAGEIGLGRRTTIEVSGGNNRWNLNGSEDDNKKLVHWIVKPEFRYWLCERFNGHFFGAHGFYGKYNVSGHDMPLLFDKEYRYEGRAIGGGISYGYHLVLGRRWGLEFNAGVGVASLKYEKSDCIKCGNVIEEATKTYFGPTAAGIKLVFIIK